MSGKPTEADWYFDILSPFSYLQLHAFEDHADAVTINPKPVVLGAILKHWGLIGPAEVPPKRLHTYRMCQWTARERGLPFRMPARHPFNPLKALRLLASIGPDIASVRTAFDFVFVEGRAPDNDEELSALFDKLGLEGSVQEFVEHQDAKDHLRANTEEAISRGVFGVPTVHVAGENFWGDDATGMMLAFLNDRAMFEATEMARLADLPVGIKRAAAPA